ncbi:MAG: hypothetical protein PHC43_08840 [Candidatus Marinimicrobia bacterium]|jgi:hypothetical protein|nr:hypothetical protein [Candidatus Neomarinimicrobiota bacterium]
MKKIIIEIKRFLIIVSIITLFIILLAFNEIYHSRDIEQLYHSIFVSGPYDIGRLVLFIICVYLSNIIARIIQGYIHIKIRNIIEIIFTLLISFLIFIPIDRLNDKVITNIISGKKPVTNSFIPDSLNYRETKWQNCYLDDGQLWKDLYIFQGDTSLVIDTYICPFTYLIGFREMIGLNKYTLLFSVYYESNDGIYYKRKDRDIVEGIYFRIINGDLTICSIKN